MNSQKTAIVTGSTRGIGLAIAKELLDNGYFVFLNYAQNVSEAKNAEEFLKSSYSGNFDIIQQELKDKESVDQFYEKIIKTETEIDVLVLNAGITDRTKWSELTWDGWNRVMDVNLNAPAALIRSFDKHFREGGNIIFIGSVLGNYAHSVSVPYSVSKAAIHTLTKALVKEYCERGIRVNAICPGFTETEWQKNKSKEQRDRICNKISLHRFAKVEEISEIVINVINSTYINGALIEADGGYIYC